MNDWSKHYKDSRWQKKRLEIMQRDGFACQCCGKEEDVVLNVHHAYYESGKKPWEYSEDSLVTLCDECHTKKHEAQKKLLVAIKDSDPCIMEFLSDAISHECSPMWDMYVLVKRDGASFKLIEKMLHLIEQMLVSNHNHIVKENKKEGSK